MRQRNAPDLMYIYSMRTVGIYRLKAGLPCACGARERDFEARGLLLFHRAASLALVGT